MCDTNVVRSYDVNFTQYLCTVLIRLASKCSNVCSECSSTCLEWAETKQMSLLNADGVEQIELAFVFTQDSDLLYQL